MELGERISNGMFDGLDAEGGIAALEDVDFVRAMRNNAFIFSGAKTFQQVKEMSDFLLDDTGKLRSFKEYREKASQIFDTFNVNWLRTEVAQAANSAQMASKWQRFEEEEDILPFLRYVTAGDERVRADHRAIDGVIKPVGDKFWNENYPPNGWNCRCNVLQESEAVPTDDSDIDLPEIPESMKINTGQKKVLFGPEHPYFVVDDQFSDLRDNNFNLPDPPDIKLGDA